MGKKLCEHSIRFVQQSGYFGIQFNIVVSTNLGAIKSWKKFGFRIIGTSPKGFRHSKLGLVETYIMFKGYSLKNLRNLIQKKKTDATAMRIIADMIQLCLLAKWLCLIKNKKFR
ncbi:hypothetical protein [Catalinimonas alkaloidigena]|uniref:GNAT family N-acetyltransferase n=1 Tax=Catalinimonas alkaloidigena TaxID=1075417 RepID=UPI0030B8F57B